MHKQNQKSQLTRREFLQRALKFYLLLLFIASLTACTTFLSPTPTPKIPHIVYVEIGYMTEGYGSFFQGLRDLGYVAEKNIVIDYQSAISPTAVGDIARGLGGTPIDLIVAGGQDAAIAVKSQTSTIPIVIAASSDAVEVGLVESLTHPGENVTGLTNFSPALNGKRLELLKQTVGSLGRVAFIG